MVYSYLRPFDTALKHAQKMCMFCEFCSNNKFCGEEIII